MSDNKSRDIFYGVVAVATLIVALVGATLAYFSISANSSEGAVNATAAVVSIEYNDGQQVSAQADELIPATLEVVQKVYEMRQDSFSQDGVIEEGSDTVCLDENNRQVCSIYRFTVRSDIERTITATLNNEHNGFTYLSYAVRDVNAGTWLTLDDANNQSLNLTTCDNSDEDGTNDCHTINAETQKKEYNTTPKAINSIFGITSQDGTVKNIAKAVASETQVYDLVIFLKENDANQNEDQGKNYQGTIIVDVVDGGSGQITGYVSNQ